MSKALIIELERCGLGRDDGPPRSFRCGLFRVLFFPNRISTVLRDYELTLDASRRALDSALKTLRAQEVSATRSVDNPGMESSVGGVRAPTVGEGSRVGNDPAAGDAA